MEDAEERVKGTTSVVVVVVVAYAVSATAAATGGQDDDGGARQSVARLRSTRVQNEAKRSPAGRSCTPGVPSSLLSSSYLRTTTRTIFFHRSTIRGRVGSRLRSRLAALERASELVCTRRRKARSPCVCVCMRCRLYVESIFNDIPLKYASMEKLAMKRKTKMRKPSFVFKCSFVMMLERA